jgi:two-component system chemotaxis sensor kinase CheA
MTLDLTQFHGVFFEESFEALDSMEAALLKLDLGAPDAELINTIFRVAHSIKGGSATFGFSEIASFTHSLETLLDELRGQRMHVTQAISNQLLQSVDVMREMLRAVQTKQPMDAQRVADVQFEVELLIAQRPKTPAAAAPPATAPPAKPAASPTAAPAAAVPAGEPRWQISLQPFPQFFSRGNDPLRMFEELAALGRLEVRADASALPELDRLDARTCYLSWELTLTGPTDESVVRQVFDWAEGDCGLEIRGENAPVKAAAPAVSPTAETAAAPRREPAQAPAPEPAAPREEHVAPRHPSTSAPLSQTEAQAISGVGESGSIRVAVEKIDELMNSVGELVITQSMLDELGRGLEGSLPESFRAGLEQLARNVREVHESVMRVRMLPISFVFSRFPRMVRDLAQKLGKQVELVLSGEQTELDKTVLEKIGDPLVHLVRNSIDHGLEKPDVRTAAGKKATGTLRLHACHRNGNIAVEVSDDGAGLNAERILAKARSRNLIGPEEALSAEQTYELIFSPGFSTAEQTTDVSGRGVGLDVVRRNVKELGGAIELTSEPGRGSRFVITLPLTLAIVDGQSIAVGRENYIVPLISIVESLQLSQGSLSRVAGRGEVFAFRGDYVPVIRLHEMFGVARERDANDGIIVVIEGDGRRAGLLVDDLLGQQQVVIKSLDTNYGRVEGVSGATILGDGSVALILDLPGIIRRANTRAHA